MKQSSTSAKRLGKMEKRIEQQKIPVRTLYTGEKIPCMGLGTFGSDKYSADMVSEAIYGAIKYG